MARRDWALTVNAAQTKEWSARRKTARQIFSVWILLLVAALAYVAFAVFARGDYEKQPWILVFAGATLVSQALFAVGMNRAYGPRGWRSQAAMGLIGAVMMAVAFTPQLRANQNSAVALVVVLIAGAGVGTIWSFQDREVAMAAAADRPPTAT